MRVKRWKETTLRYRLVKFFRRRVVIVSLAVLAQFAVLLIGMVSFGQSYWVIYFIGVLLGLLCVMHELNGRSNPEMKVAWLVPILLAPYFGGVFYLLFGSSRLTRKSRRRIEHDDPRMRKAFAPEYQRQAQVTAAFGESIIRECRGLAAMGGYPAFGNTDTEYFPTGEVMWKRMLEELEKAERFIFMEYYIVNEGEMWNSILEILARKAAQGVDVRLMYDDIGCIAYLPLDYPRKLRDMGIQVCVFNPFMPVLTSGANNRDHRKICVIDGVTAFTGGVNLSDEYVDRIRRFGYWKDTGILMRGEAAWGFTVMFLDMWDSITRREEKWQDFRPTPEALAQVRGQGLVQPIATAPFADMSLSETTIINAIRSATKYVYITTPYLIPTHDLIMALITAARSGVEVRIATPNIPDKKQVFAATRAHYPQLVEGGVKIYEYSPGFLHAKQIVVDDRRAMVGSINLDFRSLYMNFECGAWLTDAQCIPAIRADMEETFRVSERITLEKCRTLNGPDTLRRRMWRSILRIFAPLM